MSGTGTRSVLVIEGDRMVARQVSSCLALAGFDVLRPVTDVPEALAVLGDRSPDSIVMDIQTALESTRSREVIDLAAARGIPIVYLSANVDARVLDRAVDGNAAAFILKPFADRQLVSAVMLAILTVERSASGSAGLRSLSSDEKLQAIAALLHDAPRPSGPYARTPDTGDGRPDALDRLSAREREIVDLLASGARVGTIAQHLTLSPHTVRNHLKSVFRKLNLRGQHELFEYWRARA